MLKPKRYAHKVTQDYNQSQMSKKLNKPLLYNAT